MKQQDFVDAIEKLVRDKAADLTVEIMCDPSKAGLKERLLAISEWYYRMSDNDKRMIMEVVELASDITTFRFLYIIDSPGLLPLPKSTGTLEISYVDDNGRVQLNDIEESPLNELYRSLF